MEYVSRVKFHKRRSRKQSLNGSRTRDQLPTATLAKSLVDPVVVARDGMIRNWNISAERLFGYRAEEVVGKPVSVLYPPERLGELEEIVARLGRGQWIERFETVRRRKDGIDIPVSLSISPVCDLSGEIAGAAIVHDIGERTHFAEIQGFLAEASRILAATLDYEETLSRVAFLTLKRLADWCVVETIDAEGSSSEVVVAHRDPSKVETAREIRRLYPADAGPSTISRRVLTTGTAELIPEVSDGLLKNIAHDPEHLRMLRELGLRSMIVVPMRTRGRVLGTISLASAESGRRFGSEDLELAEDIAGRAALSIDNATLYKAEQRARQRAERATERIGQVQAATAALSGAVSPEAVAQVLVGFGASAFNADGGFVRLPTPDGRQLALAAAFGTSKSYPRSYRDVPLTSLLPDAEVFRTCSARYFESSAVVRAASPEFARAYEGTGQEAIAFVPLHIRGRPIGVMALSFAKLRTFDDEDRELLTTVAEQGAQALDRARLHAAEQRSRAVAERAIEQTTRLQSVAAELVEALTSAEVAEVVVRQGIESVGADAGALQLLNDDGSLLEIVHRQGTDPALIGEEWRRVPTNLKVPSTEALDSREPVFVESEQDVRENYPLVLETQAGIRPRAGAHIPLVLSGRSLGVLYLGFSRPRTFSEEQRLYVVALARQCAQALGRTQLYEAEHEERIKLSRFIEGLYEGIVSVDRRGRVRFANSTAKHMLGVAESPGKQDQVPEVWFGFPLRSFAASLFDTDGGVTEAELVGQDQEVFEIAGISAEGSDTVLVVVRDVSERERRRRADREFVANAAHELRTPLSAIASAVERLQAGAREDPEKRDRFIGHIQRESGRLNRLTSSLLLLARVQMRVEVPRRDEILLRGLLEELVGHFEVNKGVGVVLECPSDLSVSTNRDLLEHALLNLVSNAVRHTERGQIRVDSSVHDDGSVTIEVVDTGVGIPADGLSRLFERFYRGSGEDPGIGFGLGLPITKDAIEAIGGRIEIDSVVGVGTTARIVLPGADVPVVG
jgi:PAS domain S-box-containing protein